MQERELDSHNVSDQSQQHRAVDMAGADDVAEPSKDIKMQSKQGEAVKASNQKQNLKSAKKVKNEKKNKPAFKTTDLMLGRVQFQNSVKKSFLEDEDKMVPTVQQTDANNFETDRNQLSTGREMITDSGRKSDLVKASSIVDKNPQIQLKQERAVRKSDITDKDKFNFDDVQCQEISPAPSIMKYSYRDNSAFREKSNRLEEELNAPRVKNPKFNDLRNSILDRPSHYNTSSVAVAAEGGEVNHEEIELADKVDGPDKAKIANVANCFAPKAAPPEQKNAIDLDSEKKGYMLKEQEFYKALKFVQNYYLEICICLMKLGKFFFFLTSIYALVCMFWFGCGVGDCQNTLVCCVHYIKLIQGFGVYSSYSHNIEEKQPTHPIGTLNAFVTILLYYFLLYVYKDILVEDENLIHFISIYLIIDAFLIMVSFFAVRKVKIECNKLITNKKFKEYSQEAELALQDVLYLPVDIESEEEDAEM